MRCWLGGVQKRIIRRANVNKFVITAHPNDGIHDPNPMPTRAEVSDVANAVFDSTDAVMLSASAVGSTRRRRWRLWPVFAWARADLPHAFRNIDWMKTFIVLMKTVALSAMYAANHFAGVRAIICMTETGRRPC